MIGQKNIAHEDDAGMANQVIKITALDFLGQAQVLFHHLKENLNAPTLPLNTDVFLVGKIDVGRQDLQPVAVGSVANEYQLTGQPTGKRYHHAG